ncbi:MAG: MurR/RpiR family transcriptional regulator, partial [Oscillospiraceae bacterium]
MGNTDIFNHLIQDFNKLTKSEMVAADYVLKHKLEVQNLTISELAAASGVSEATLTRFCHTVGCKGFNDFKLAIAQATARSDRGPVAEYDSYGDVHAEDSIEDKCQKLCSRGIDALRQTLAMIDTHNITTAVDMICRANRVLCFGQGNSSIVAADAWGRFSSTTPKFNWISDSHMQVSAAALLEEDDVILYFSFSGATRALVEIGELCKKSKAHMILVTRYPHSPGAAYADLILICGANESPLQQGSVSAKIAQLFIVDILFNEYCARDLDTSVRNRQKTLDAIGPKLL